MKQLICEKNGKKSITRIVLIVAVLMAIYSTIVLQDIAMVGTWLGISGLTKVANKSFEK